METGIPGMAPASLPLRRCTPGASDPKSSLKPPSSLVFLKSQHVQSQVSSRDFMSSVVQLAQITNT